MLTQDDFMLYTSENINYSDENWELIQEIAQLRLASLLCLDTFPELNETNQDLAMLLANFISATIKFQGAQDAIESKSVRNFTINFKNSATNAFEQIYSQYRDIIEKYSKCDLGVRAERSDWHCCGYYNNGYFNF